MKVFCSHFFFLLFFFFFSSFHSFLVCLFTSAQPLDQYYFRRQQFQFGCKAKNDQSSLQRQYLALGRQTRPTRLNIYDTIIHKYSIYLRRKKRLKEEEKERPSKVHTRKRCLSISAQEKIRVELGKKKRINIKVKEEM